MSDFHNARKRAATASASGSASPALVVLSAFGILIGRFVWLQVLQHDYYRTRAEDNRIALVPIVPNRGVITDRNGVVLARNYSAYTLEITPAQTDDLEATIDALAEVIDIQAKDRKRFKTPARREQEFRVAADSHPPDRRGSGQASPPSAIASPASRSRPACSASIRSARSLRT